MGYIFDLFWNASTDIAWWYICVYNSGLGLGEKVFDRSNLDLVVTAQKANQLLSSVIQRKHVICWTNR